MKFKLRAIVTFAVSMIPLALISAGCSGPDNPKIVDAPAPPAPKPDEVKTRSTNVGNKTVEYGSHPQYKKAMDRLNK